MLLIWAPNFHPQDAADEEETCDAKTPSNDDNIGSVEIGEDLEE